MQCNFFMYYVHIYLSYTIHLGPTSKNKLLHLAESSVKGGGGGGGKVRCTNF